MAYEKNTWIDNETPITAEKLNKMEQGIEDAGKTGGVQAGAVIGWTGETVPEGYKENSTMLSAIANAFFPLGYTFIDTTGQIDYSNHLGLVWEKTLQGVTPVGQNTSDTDFATIGKTGGSKEHFHNVKNAYSVYYGAVVGSDNNAIRGYNYQTESYPLSSAMASFETTKNNGITNGSTKVDAGQYSTNGTTSTESSMQPYQVVTFWTRVG